jgi:hypothetical protein
MDINQLALKVRNQGKDKLENEWEGYDDLSFCEGIGAVLRATAEIESHSKNDQEFKKQYLELVKVLSEMASEEVQMLENYYNKEFD